MSFIQAPTAKWTHFLHQCLLRRTNGDDFQELADFMAEKYRISGRLLLKIIMDCRSSFCLSADPLIPHYIHAVLAAGMAHPSDVLFAMIQRWNVAGKEDDFVLEDAVPRNLSGPDTPIIYDLAATAISSKPILDTQENCKCLIFAAKWLSALAEWVSKDPDRISDLPAMTLTEAIAFLIVTIAGTDQGMALLDDRQDTAVLELRSTIQETFTACLQLMLNISPQLHGRLYTIQEHFDLFEQSHTKDASSRSAHGPQIDALQFEANVPEGSSIRARASLFVYIDAALSARPLIGDNVLLSFLNARYAGDNAAMFIDVIVAVFDVLANGSRRKEPEQTMNSSRSFLMNKVPQLLSLIFASSMEQISAETCISQALSRVDPNIFPTFSSAFDSSSRGAFLADVRQDFLFACALHRLIPESSIESLLGETPMQTLPAHGLYSKETIIQQITLHQKRGDQLVEEIESMEGNAGTTVQALIEVMHNLARNKETVALKELCNSIVRKPQSMDVMTLFQSPAVILGPLCTLLDGWRWDELQGESQPVYDEFGSILLLILTFKYRYNLHFSDIGSTGGASFVRRLIEEGPVEQPIEQLDEAMSKHLGEWISALFVAEGLNDELTSSCSPQEFYRLVPTLFSQSLEACEHGRLSLETLKSGFEYLLEPFLLPSLVIALFWLKNHIWETNSRLQSSLQLLGALIKPPTSFEAREIHQTILAITADPLQQELRAARGQQLADTEIQSLLSALEPYAHSTRYTFASRSEVNSWTSNGAGMLSSIRHMFQAIVSWSTNMDINIIPIPNFTYKQIVTGVQLYGATTVLHVLIEELKLISGTSRFDHGIDIVAGIICAVPMVHPSLRTAINLRDALKLDHANLAKILEKEDPTYADALVQLHRRVETLFILVPQHNITMDNSSTMDAHLDSLDLQNINLQAAAAGAEFNVADLEAAQAQPEDIDKMLDAAAAVDEYGTGTLGDSIDDVFGVDSVDMGMVNFDDIDMEGMF